MVHVLAALNGGHAVDERYLLEAARRRHPHRDIPPIVDPLVDTRLLAAGAQVQVYVALKALYLDLFAIEPYGDVGVSHRRGIECAALHDGVHVLRQPGGGTVVRHRAEEAGVVGQEAHLGAGLGVAGRDSRRQRPGHVFLEALHVQLLTDVVDRLDLEPLGKYVARLRADPVLAADDALVGFVVVVGGCQ